MKFFHPQIQLVRELVLDSPSIYYLHIVTFCPRTCFVADGYETPGFGPDNETLAEGLYQVIIHLREDSELPDFDYITPIVHTINLGGIVFPDDEGFIEVQVKGVVTEPDNSAARTTKPPKTTTKTGGKGTVSTTIAEDKSRPMDTESLR
ncbi:MAG: hypothetical protein LCH81_12460 [Bacteroidetes bacterium]|nr:hypothetical protein [Bacteroidota bacterium]